MQIQVGDLLWECNYNGKLFHHKVERVTAVYFWAKNNKWGGGLTQGLYRNDLSKIGQRIFHTPEECVEAFIARKNQELAAALAGITQEITNARESLAAIQGVEHV